MVWLVYTRTKRRRREEKLSVKCDIYSCFALFLRLFWSRSSLDVKWADIFKDEPNFLEWGWLDVLVVFPNRNIIYMIILFNLFIMNSFGVLHQGYFYSK